MTKPIDYVRATGLVLYGEQWQSALAADLKVSDRAVRRWVAGDANPPEDIAPRLRALLDKRLLKLRAVRISLPK
jgi:hypothetical protein